MDAPDYSVPTARSSEDVSGMNINAALTTRYPSSSVPAAVLSKVSEDNTDLSLKDVNPHGRGPGQSMRSRGGTRRELRAEREGFPRGETAPGSRGTGFGQSSRSNQQYSRHPSVDPARVVKRPISETQNTRQFQLSQLRRRFRFQEGGHVSTNTETEFHINLAPSDPEFPYNVDILKFVLTVPPGYSSSVIGGGGTAVLVEENYPHIHVLNEDIPMGFRINIENGFRDIAKNASRETTLLDMVNTLDKRLEGFLAAEKASTIKIMPNTAKKTGTITGSKTGSKGLMESSNAMKPIAHLDAPPVTKTDHKEVIQLSAYTADELSSAAARRGQDIQRLEARLGRSNNFIKTEAPDGELIYTVPLEARRRDLLPDSFSKLQSIILRVPKYFNLQPCIIKISGLDVAGELSRALEQKFTEQVLANPNWSLMAHLNALAANLHVMATEVVEEVKAEKRKKDEKEKEIIHDIESKAVIDHVDSGLLMVKKEGMSLVDDDKGDIVVIPRPPEWSHVYGEEDKYDESGTESDSDYTGVSEDDEKKQEVILSGPPRERGTALSFPGIQMPGIQLLEVLFINVTTKCSKCKTTTDIIQIRPGGKPRFDRCEKCSGIFGIGKFSAWRPVRHSTDDCGGFRMEPVHQFSNRAGFFDLTCCTITEILPRYVVQSHLMDSHIENTC